MWIRQCDIGNIVWIKNIFSPNNKKYIKVKVIGKDDDNTTIGKKIVESMEEQNKIQIAVYNSTECWKEKPNK